MENIKLEESNNSIQDCQCHPVKVKLQRFWCGDIPFVAYQLPDGRMAMSQTQSLPTYSRVLSKMATDFIAENHLPTLTVTLPNHTTIVLYPLLPTVFQLWSYFLFVGKLSFERKKLLNELRASTPILEDSKRLLSKTIIFRKEVEQAPTTLARTVDLKIGTISFQAFFYEGNVYISDNEGLSIINVTLSWIIELNPAQKKAMALKRSGFSFKEEILFYRESRLFKIRARSWSDWLVVWEYFASKGNNKALSLLRHLAGQSLEQWLRTL